MGWVEILIWVGLAIEEFVTPKKPEEGNNKLKHQTRKARQKNADGTLIMLSHKAKPAQYKGFSL